MYKHCHALLRIFLRKLHKEQHNLEIPSLGWMTVAAAVMRVVVILERQKGFQKVWMTMVRHAPLQICTDFPIGKANHFMPLHHHSECRFLGFTKCPTPIDTKKLLQAFSQAIFKHWRGGCVSFSVPVPTASSVPISGPVCPPSVCVLFCVCVCVSDPICIPVFVLALLCHLLPLPLLLLTLLSLG
jgi:hypothetical protein